MSQVAEIMLSQAVELAEKLEAAGVLAYWDQIEDLTSLRETAERMPFIIIVHGDKDRTKAEAVSSRVVSAPKADLTRQAQMSLGVLSASAQGLFNSGDILVCLAGPAGEGRVDMIQVVKTTEAGTLLCSQCHDAWEDKIPPQVFRAVLSLAVELAHEGREGKPIGTIFVIGDHAKVLQFSRQTVLNPFAGYPEDQLSVLHQAMKETIREFSSLDGAFVIRGDGVLNAAGRQLQATASDLELPQGMGARHHAAAGITAVTEAVALVISESSGTVTVFHRGQIIASLEKAGPSFGLESGGSV